MSTIFKGRDGMRGLVSRDLRGGAIRPGASPVSTFVQPSRGGKLDQLAQGLSTLAPGLARFSDTVSANQNNQAGAEGEQAARELQELGTDLAEAVRSGAIDPTANPFFKIGFKEQYGRYTAARYQEELARRYHEVEDSIDPGAFDAWEREIRAEFLAENVGENRDQAFEAGFGRTVDQNIDRMRIGFASEVSERQLGAMRDAFQSTIASSINSLVPPGGADADPEEWEAFAASMAEEIQSDLDTNTVSLGLDRRTFNRVAADALLEAIRVHGPGVSKIFSQVQTGNTTLLEVPGVGPKIIAAEEAYHLRRNNEQGREADEKQKEMEAHQASLHRAMFENPDHTAEDRQAMAREYYDRYGETSETIAFINDTASLMQSVESVQFGMAPRDFVGHQVDAATGRMSLNQIDSNAREGLYDSQQYNSIRAAAERHRSAQPGPAGALKPTDVFNHHSYRRAEQELASFLRDPDMLTAMSSDPNLQGAIEVEFMEKWIEFLSNSGLDLDNLAHQPTLAGAAREIIGNLRSFAVENRPARNLVETRSEGPINFGTFIEQRSTGAPRAVDLGPEARQDITLLTFTNPNEAHHQAATLRLMGLYPWQDRRVFESWLNDQISAAETFRQERSFPNQPDNQD